MLKILGTQHTQRMKKHRLRMGHITKIMRFKDQVVLISSNEFVGVELLLNPLETSSRY